MRKTSPCTQEDRCDVKHNMIVGPCTNRTTIASSQEIGLRDVRLAVGMMDQRVTDTAALGGERLRTTVAREINSRPLLLAGPNRPGVIAAPQGAGGVDPSSQCSIPKHAVRMVPEINSSLLKRSFSYIPGGDAYESAASSSSSGAGGADLSSTSAGAGAAASSSAVLAGVSQAALMRMLLPPTAPRIQMSLASSSSSSASGGGVAAGAAASGAGVKRCDSFSLIYV